MLGIFRKISIFLIFLSIDAFAIEEANLTIADPSAQGKKLEFQWDFVMGGFNYVDGQDESQIVLLQIKPQVQYRLTKDIKLKSEVWISLNSARSQSRFQNPTFNTFNLMDLTATYNPDDLFSFSVGAINQNHLGNRFLVADRAFPGVLLKSGYKNKKLSAFFTGQYTIPTSTSFESDRTKAEALPSFTTAGVELSLKPWKWLQYDSKMHYFQFNNLPSVVAFDSGRLGNQVQGTDPSESLFTHQFSGYSLAHDLKLRYSHRIKQLFALNILENLQAPTDRRRSQMLGTGFEFDFEDIKLIPFYSSFYSESDATPALYSAFEYGRTNRKGQFYSLKMDFKKYGFSIYTNYIESNVIQAKALQKDMRYLEFVLEVTDVAL